MTLQFAAQFTRVITLAASRLELLGQQNAGIAEMGLPVTRMPSAWHLPTVTTRREPVCTLLRQWLRGNRSVERSEPLRIRFGWQLSHRRAQV